MRPLETVASETGVDLATVRKVAAALSKDRKLDPDVVELRHPKLPADQVITVDRRRVGVHLAAGWEEVTQKPKPERQPSESAGEEPKPTEPKRRSRTKSEEQ